MSKKPACFNCHRPVQTDGVFWTHVDGGQPECAAPYDNGSIAYPGIGNDDDDDVTKIHLTPSERQAAAIAAQDAIRKGKRHHGVVIAVIAAINAERSDDE